MSIHSNIKHLLSQGQTFERKHIFQKKGINHDAGLKKPHSLFDVDKNVLKDLMKFQPDYILIPLEINGLLRNIYLQKVDAIPPNVITSSGNKHSTNIIHYRGSLDSEFSWCTFTFTEKSIIGVVSDESGNYNIGQVIDEDTYIVAEESELTDTNPNICDTSQNAQGGFTPSQPSMLPTSVKVVQLYWEVRKQVFDSFGSLDKTMAFIQAVFNQVQTVYANHGFSVNLKTLKIWDTADPYTQTNANGLLNQFGQLSSYITNQTGYKRGFGDVAQLIGFGYGGIAWTGTLNATNASARMTYCGISNSYLTAPNYSWTVDCLTHELGHIYGNPHTHEYSWNGNNTQIDGCGTGCTLLPVNDKGTIMSYCHLCSCGKKLVFHPQCVQLMQYYLDHATDIPYPDAPVPPTPPSCLITGPTAITQGQSAVLSAPDGMDSYLWSTGATTKSITVTTAGTYTITISKAGVSSSCSLTLTVNPAPTPNPLPTVTPCPYPNATYPNAVPKKISGTIVRQTSSIKVVPSGYTNYKYAWYEDGIKKTWTSQTVANENLVKGKTYACIIGSTNAQKPTDCHQDGLCSIVF